MDTWSTDNTTYVACLVVTPSRIANHHRREARCGCESVIGGLRYTGQIAAGREVDSHVGREVDEKVVY